MEHQVNSRARVHQDRHLSAHSLAHRVTFALQSFYGNERFSDAGLAFYYFPFLIRANLKQSQTIVLTKGDYVMLNAPQ